MNRSREPARWCPSAATLRLLLSFSSPRIPRKNLPETHIVASVSPRLLRRLRSNVAGYLSQIAFLSAMCGAGSGRGAGGAAKGDGTHACVRKATSRSRPPHDRKQSSLLEEIVPLPRWLDRNSNFAFSSIPTYPASGWMDG